jgi:ketosteroid isomerase-like protein
MGLTSADREAIRSLAEDRWVSALLTRDVDALASMCAPDLVYMAADQPAIRGIEEFRAWVLQFPAVSAFTQPVESMEGNGKVAIARARSGSRATHFRLGVYCSGAARLLRAPERDFPSRPQNPQSYL